MPFENIAKSLYVANQLPLDKKAYFNTLTEMKDLGVSDYNAFTYYEYMKVMCVELGAEFVWKEVDINDTSGILDNNYLYPADTISEGIDYSNRYFNFIAVDILQEFVVPSLLIFKSPENNPSNRYLESKDVALGFFAANDFRTMRYVSGPVISETSWADIDSFAPNGYPQNT